jgi:hypothetical protein
MRPQQRQGTRAQWLPLILVVLALVGYVAWNRYKTTSVATLPDEGGPPVTQIITAKLSGTTALKVAELSGTVQASAADIRGLGLLRTDQVVKMPYSVDYFVDLSKLKDRQLSWNPDTRTLIVDAPDVAPARPNTDEGRRTLVKTTGLFVTRGAGEELSRRTSIHAAQAAAREASSPERMAQAREHARRAIAQVLAQPLKAAGLGGVRVVVTFPPERSQRDGEQWDMSKPVDEVLANRR